MRERSHGTAGESGQGRKIKATTEGERQLERESGWKDSRSESSRGKMRARERECVCTSVCM